MSKQLVRPADRQTVLTQRRRMKMAESAHAYVRGNTLKFYEWLESARAIESIAAGPPVWICGDCHIGNIGPVANTDGQVEIQIRDLDHGHWESGTRSDPIMFVACDGCAQCEFAWSHHRAHD